MNIRTDLGGAIVGAVMLIAPALQALAADTHPCSVVTEDASRLACYDAAFGKPAARSSASAAEFASPVAAAAPASAAPSVASATAPVAAGAGVAAVAAVATQPVDPVQTFGFEGPPPEPKKVAKAAKPQETESISSVITAVNKRLLGELVVELENGQVWTQLETDPSVRLQVGAAATISKGSLGSYRLISGTNATKVKRTK